MKLFRAAVLVVVLAVVTVLTPASAQAKNASKYELVGPKAVVLCEPPHAPLDTPTVTKGVGFVVFKHDKAANKLKTVVSIKGGAANTRYVVRVVQATADCYIADGVLTTNLQGNGTLSLSETAVSRAAQVIIDTKQMFANPTYRASEPYLYPGLSAKVGNRGATSARR